MRNKEPKGDNLIETRSPFLMPDLGPQKGYEKNNHKIPTHWLGAVKQPAVPPELAKAFIKKEDA